MVQYLLRRIVLFLPTLLLISWIAFGLSKCSNSDPVAAKCASSDMESFVDLRYQKEQCQAVAESYGLNKPAFYFAVRPAAFPDSLYRIVDQNERTARRNLIAQYGNWDSVQDYFDMLDDFQKAVYLLPDSINADVKISLKTSIDQLQIAYKEETITYHLTTIENRLQKDSLFAVRLETPFGALHTAYRDVLHKATPSKLKIPTLHWYGLDNQYHHWIIGFLTGNFGLSYFNDEPVSTRIWSALKWTLTINAISILIAYLISIPLGVWTAVNRHTWKDRLTSTLLFMLYALPSFWVATLLILFFTTPEYGMDWFPTSSLSSLEDSVPFWTRFWDTAYHLILPVFCVTYTAFAFITRQMRSGMLQTLEQDYMKTAKSKGLSPRKQIWKHGFRNALFPIITIFANIFPATIAGSVIIEVIFRIPGMGRLAYESLFQGDWPILYTVLMLVAILTMLGNLVADSLFAMADPRVKFE